MKKRLCVLFIILLFGNVYAQEEDYNTYNYLKTRVELNTGFNLVMGQDHSINYITANLSLYPKSSLSYDVLNLNIKSQPEAVIEKGDTIIFRWDNPVERENFGFEAEVKTKNIMIPVTEKIKFPLQNIDDPILPYTQSSEFIDINQEIVNKANELASGEDDLYSVVFKIADWTRNNINYNLSTLTAEVNQKSSWVLQNKQGVCDELTSLFISLLRSVGIPARFISGTAYTNLGYRWGNHGWAEVYFPGYGWIPFDVTYGQYGWIDPSHIKLSSNVDSGDPSIKYTWAAYNVDIVADKIAINTSLIEVGEKISPFVRISATPLVNDVGPESYMPIKVNVENLQDFYLPITLQVVKAPDLTEENVKSLLLKPRQQKSLYWIIQVPKDLKARYLYSTLFEVKDYFGSSDTAKINYALNYEVISLDDAKNMIVPEQEEKTYSKNLAMECSSKNYFYSYEEYGTVICDLKNIGNVIISDIDVCLSNECKKVDMNIAEAKKVKFNISLINISKNIVISTKSDDVILYRYLNLNVIESPNLRINNIIQQEIIPYNEQVNMSLILNTDAPVYNIAVRINNQEFIIDKLDNIEKISFDINSKYLLDKNDIVLRYEDENKNIYETSDIFYVNLINVPWHIKIINLFKGIF